jgi:hypothetical protein
MDVTKPCKFIGFRVMDVINPPKKQGLGPWMSPTPINSYGLEGCRAQAREPGEGFRIRRGPVALACSGLPLEFISNGGVHRRRHLGPFKGPMGPVGRIRYPPYWPLNPLKSPSPGPGMDKQGPETRSPNKTNKK